MDKPKRPKTRPAPKAAQEKKAARKKAKAPAEKRPRKRAPRAKAPRAEPEQHPAEPLVEGFFVARVAGEDEVRRHHLTEDQAPPPVETTSPRRYEENLGELPHAYEDDSAVLLPRDPETLFFFWDFHPKTCRAAAEGLPEPRAVLRVYDADVLVREIDFALESHSYYLHGLTPGRRYRVEAHFVGKDGRSRRLGGQSNPVVLPRVGPSPNLEVRLMRIPWGVPLSRLKDLLTQGRVRLLEGAGVHLGPWPRIELPTSPHWREAAVTEGRSYRPSASGQR